MTLATVESAILTTAQATLGTTARKYASLPGGWTVELLQLALQASPSVHVAFLGGAAPAGAGDSARINARFAVYVVTKQAQEEQRRLGTLQAIGAYDMLTRLIPVLHNKLVTDVGTLRLVSVDNVFRDMMMTLGGTVYGAIFELPNLAFEYTADLDTLDDFVTFDAEYDFTPADPADNPIGHDTVTLPQ